MDSKLKKIVGRYSEEVCGFFLSNGLNSSDFTFRDIVKTSADMLFVEHIDMCQNINKPTHYTTEYDTNNLVVRRGQEFIIRVTFSRLLTQQDDFQLEFLIGPNPSHNKGSLVVVTFNTRHGGPWSGRVINMEGPSAVLGITPSPNAIVGKFRTYVAILVGGEMQRTKRDQSTDLYLLFNAWCPEDPVFLPNEEERREYVLNDMGIIYQGNASTVTPRSWMYGQFEKGILDACIYILDSSRMPIFNRGNVIKLVRKGSAMINSQDDNGVLVGNWSNDYSMGTRPTAWTGSVKILLKYANTGVPVCFAQCWVFAGVFNTFLRCFGIPSRVITNFSSAHDNTGNLKTDLIFNMDGTPDRRNTRDSIWNYHCWNEVNMVRYDLPPGYGGWQVVDATPQETSDGHYRCGPASVNAIKKGLLCHPFDAGFVLLRLVNSDVVFLKRDKYGTLTPFKVDTTHVGQALYTKAVGSNAPVNVTQTYKYPEGELKPDEATMLRAEEFGCERDHSDVPCLLGADMKVEVAFQNHGNTPTSVEAHMEVSTIFYTGAIANHFKDQDFVVDIQPGGSECPYVPSNLIPSCSVPSNLVQSQSSPISSHPVTSLPVLPHPIHSIVAYPIPSHPVPSHPVLSCPTQSSPVQYISCSVASSPIPPVLSNPVQSVLSCSILSCPVLSSPVPSHPVRSRPVPSCSIPSRPVLSSLFVD
uniref:Transglutaminase-like domain-containing protein n=1 Tax=Salarias fasciatus TaxID=181472 RepID=A0A672FU78_SALFA